MCAMCAFPLQRITMTKTVVLASNRTGVFEEIKKIPFLKLSHVFVVPDSRLHQEINGTAFSLIHPQAPDPFLKALDQLDFDLLISNGCPVIIPVSRLKKKHQLFLNVHPSLLPEFRGYHPANGVLLHKAQEAGATLHEMVDRVDRGQILAQERFPVTSDLDLGLLYHLLFSAEARVFTRGIHKLHAQEFQIEGESQSASGSHYKRSSADMSVDFETMKDEEILRRIRAFGTLSQGVHCSLQGCEYTLFEAHPLGHPLLFELHAAQPPGSVVLTYDGGMVVRSLESLIRISRFAPVTHAR